MSSPRRLCLDIDSGCSTYYDFLHRKQLRNNYINNQYSAANAKCKKKIKKIPIASVKEERLREVPRGEPRLKWDISWNNNRTISILQRRLIEDFVHVFLIMIF